MVHKAKLPITLHLQHAHVQITLHFTLYTVAHAAVEVKWRE